MNTDTNESQKDGGAALFANATPIETIHVEQLADIFKGAGYRVTAAEFDGNVQLMSASQGVGFTVRFGNPAPADAADSAAPAAFFDYTLSCALQVQGELPAELVPTWNRTKRFARLSAHQQFLVLEMDVVVAGGVSERHIRSMIELWDRLIQEFLLHLRNRPVFAAAEQAATGSGATSAATEEKAAPKDPANPTLQ
ncbi:YbjN domain-containing protein [Paraburkholderia sp.]|uniref:YbjN domain-containing protein n=1 Tax=Paraburkholderia sp. TaxID=1926495 RepID=UPI003D6E9020